MIYPKARLACITFAVPLLPIALFRLLIMRRKTCVGVTSKILRSGQHIFITSEGNDQSARLFSLLSRKCQSVLGRSCGEGIDLRLSFRPSSAILLWPSKVQVGSIYSVILALLYSCRLSGCGLG